MVLAGVLTLGLVLSLAPGAVAEHYEDTVEIQGATPVEAAVSFSRLAFPGGATEAALGRDDAFADSLASGVLQTTAPLLLTPTASLAPAVDSELKRLGVSTVHVLGGTSAISTAVEQQLTEGGYTVRRHSGPTRIETAIAVAQAIAPSSSEVIVARAFGGEGDPTQAFADSLAAGAWAAGSGSPILLTETERLSASTQAYLRSAAPLRAYVVGGASAVSDATLAQIASLGIQAERVSGPTRFDTAVEIAKRRGLVDASDGNGVVLLEGQAEGAWAPGFAAAAYAAVERSAVVLASGDTLPSPTTVYLDAGDEFTGLACGPQLSEAACDAAAEALGKRLAPTVTLDQGSIPQFGDVTGTVTPPEEILSLMASGCGLTDRAVVAGQDGTFSTRIEGAPGECTLVFEVETRTRGDFTKTFALTVTEPEPATAAPELVKVEVASTGALVGTVRFVFSEIVRATSYQGTGRIPATRFLLYGARGVRGDESGEIFRGLDGEDDGPNRDIPDPGAAPRRDPENNRAVLVDFRRAEFDKATTAAVEKHAAEDVDSTGSQPTPSLPGSAPLKAFQLPGARTDNVTGQQDLVSVGSVTAQNMPTGEFRADFVFDDDPASLTTANLFGVVLADGRLIPAKSVASAGTNTIRATFALADTQTPEGTACSGSGCPTLQAALSGVRRAYVAETAERPFQAVTVAGDGLTTRADLKAITLDTANGTADFAFDETVTGADVNDLSLYLVNGDELPVSEAQVVADGVVRVKAAVSKLVVGGSAAAGAVTASSGQSPPAAVGVAQTFAAGELVGPRLEAAGVTFIGDGATDSTTGRPKKKWKVTWTFDRAIVSHDGTNLTLYASDGIDVHQLTACQTVEQEAPKSISCEVELKDDQTPAVASVSRDAVRSAGAIPDTTVQNIERSVRL